MVTDTDNSIDADYVVIGAGAMGMAFVDEILTHSDATVAMIDRHARPGGHWNDAYPYVRLHQPSYFYGVSSTRLGTDRIDDTGLNAGMSELASGAEVCAYFDQVMQRRFLSSGRVQYFPSTTYAAGVATSVPSGASFRVAAHRATVDATFMKVKVPSTRPPAYEVDPAVTVIPPNALPSVEQPAGGFCVVGAGKTAFDALIWLLGNHVDPDDIRWIAPRDSWLINRAVTQPGDGFRFYEQIDMIADADSPAELFDALESSGHFLRVDPSIEPTMYRCATVTEAEVAELRRITQVIRGGRVEHITSSTIELDNGSVPSDPDTVYVDCTADGLERLAAEPVFADGRITLQTLRPCQQVFSAGLIGRIETLTDTSIESKNELAGVVPHPDTTHDFFTTSLAHIHNMGRWAMHGEVSAWISTTRLSPGTPRAEGGLLTAIRAAENLAAFIAS